MKTLLTILGLGMLGLNVLADVGPDLSAGTDTQYFTKLRFDTAQKGGFPPIWKSNPERRKIQEAYRAGEVESVLSLSDSWLKRLPIDADVHLMVAMCYKEKGDLVNMCQHLNVFYGLLGSITSAGDGLSEQTAFRVVSLEEEYSLIQEIGGKVKNQKLIGNIDRLEVERRGGKTVTLYFDVSVHLKALAKSFEGK
ncbi:MAG: DUF4919 domain-containing protein [Verrucomicrobia bacterium]|nr:DUF4919 domain-containing protein [Verrucomicrobiota bacterium]